jgi:signal transduction histidine kinase
MTAAGPTAGEDWRGRCQALERELGELASSLAHDLRAPARAMSGFARALEQQYGARLDATGREYLRHVQEGALEMSRHIEALAQLALVSAAPLRLVPVALDAVAREILAALARRAPGEQREVVVEDGLEAVGDPHLLRRLLECLLGNAWRFTGGRSGGRIEVGQRGAVGATLFFVRDNGTGFDMRYAGRLFKPFTRLHPASGDEGPGIGLAIARRIVQRHGGTITAEGEPGKGAVFTFALGLGAAGPPLT